MKYIRDDYPSDMPLCSFGPGGAYTVDYTPTQRKLKHKTSKQLNSLLSMIAIALREKLPISYDSNNHYSLESEHAKEFNAAQTRDTSTDKRIYEQPTLFPNNPGIGIGSEKKQNNRIRTLRRTTRKRFTLDISRKSSLFEINSPSY
jgi:hypothetical protein